MTKRERERECEGDEGIEDGTKSQERVVGVWRGWVWGQGLRVSLGSLTQISHTELIAAKNNGRRASGNPSCRSMKEKKNKI